MSEWMTMNEWLNEPSGERELDHLTLGSVLLGFGSPDAPHRSCGKGQIPKLLCALLQIGKLDNAAPDEAKDSSWESPLGLPGTNHPRSPRERSSCSSSLRLCLLMQKIKRDGGWGLEHISPDLLSSRRTPWGWRLLFSLSDKSLGLFLPQE